MEAILNCFLTKRKMQQPLPGTNRTPIFTLFIVMMFFVQAFAGTTGKISGTIMEKSSGEPMPGVNVFLEGFPYGAATDTDGYYYILNVPPGTYTVVAQMVGFSTVKMTNVKVNVDLTTDIHFQLEEEMLQGEAIVVVAERPLIQKDLTSSAANISSDEIAELPVTSFNEVIELQAGVVDGHFRGGRQGEVSYLIDGIPVNDPYDNSLSIEIENSSIQNLEVISGTFNAEYGQAMSGVVNIVTREGGDDYDFDATYYTSTHYTTHDKIFPELDDFGSNSANDFQFSVAGPLPVFKKLKFFVTGRINKSDGHYFGPELYLPSDEFYFLPGGDSSYVAQAPSERKSLHGKLTYYLLPSLKLNYAYMMEDRTNRYYNHDFRLNPSGTKDHFNDAYNHNLILSHTFKNNTYYDIKFSKSYNHYKGYVYEDPYDPRYLDSDNGRPESSYTFRQGGNETDRYNRHTKTFLTKFDLFSQVNKVHKIGLGFQYKKHDVYNFWTQLDMENSAENDEIIYPAKFSTGREEYEKEPYEFSAYIQDKVEYNNFIINIGIRYDYFNANTSMPSDLKNPEQLEEFPKGSVEATAKSQLSPRLGVAFPISSKGVIHVSYGHFFQNPDASNLYEGITDQAGTSRYYLPYESNLSSIKGNPDLKSERTTQYELGLQQELTEMLAMDFNVFYRDIRNLTSTEIIETYDTKKYARYINQDYGNIRGMTVSLEKRFASHWGGRLDYTYQIAEGNASDPLSVYYDNTSYPPRESEKSLIPLDWDQRSTLNFSLSTGTPGNWNVTLTGQYGSGMPYTNNSRYTLANVNFRNDRTKPSTMTFDLRADKRFKIGNMKLTTFLLVENLFDRLNEYGVYGSTGRADWDINIQENEVNIIGYNTLADYLRNPGMYSAPRNIRLGLSVGF